MRRHMVLAAAPACALLVFSPFSARAADVTVPAPPGAASAVALQVGSLLDISKTSAIAQDSPSTAEASVIRIGGQTLLGLGGSQEGNGEKSGALLDTGASNPIRVEVAPWAAAVEEKADPTKTRRSKAEAALVRANVANVVKAALLHSKSEAEWTDLKSTGSAFSNGVELSVANAISVVLLHSEVRTDGQGRSYLVGLNGNEIGTDSQLGNSPLCALTVQSVLALSCLDASGGGGSTVPGEAREAAAEVARVDPAIDAIKIIDPVGAFTTASSSGGGAPAITLPAAPAPIPAPVAEQARTPDAIAPAATLPRTGAALAGFVVFGLVALLGGALLRLASRRRVTA